ncbi:MAG: hypothetical protein ACUVRX_05715 [Actinomycetota bacterium]
MRAINSLPLLGDRPNKEEGQGKQWWRPPEIVAQARDEVKRREKAVMRRLMLEER